VIPEDGHLLVAFDRNIGIELIADHVLDRDGDGVSLWNEALIRQDHIAWNDLRGPPIDSLARVPDGGYHWLRQTPTPGDPNPEP
jgi:hypothetical protein